MLSKHTFRWLYTSDVIKTTDYYAKSLSGKVLPSFEDISEEADKAEQGCYNRLASLSDPESFDPGDIVDDARDAGVAFYIMAKGVRQGIINLFTAGLYHLFEQQALRLYRTELLWSGEENIPGLLTVKEARQRLLEDYEIDIFAFPSWSKLEELRLVANTVKHADGVSCTQLKQVRPDLFIHPSQRHYPSPWAADLLNAHPVLQPLAGEDLYISPDDFTSTAWLKRVTLL